MREDGPIVGVPRERHPGETRVALTPAQIPVLSQAGLRVRIEQGAGSAAGYRDSAYLEHGAEVTDRSATFAADVLVQVRTLGADPSAGRADLPMLRRGQIVVGLADPLFAHAEIREMADRGVTLFALELIPRIARAQSMDVQSSQSTVAGYRAVIVAAERLPKLFPMLTTAAGTVAPSRVFVIGAGVAGLQAIATARRLGAMVEAYDVRPAAQDDVESLGAKLVPLPLAPGAAEDPSGYAKALGDAFYARQQEHLTRVVAGVDVVVCTAMIPGGPAPILLTEEGVRSMAPGSVVIDVAAARGGNCSLTRPDEEVVAYGVTILGPTNLPASAPYHASQLFARNVTTFLLFLMKEGKIEPNVEDEIVRATMVASGGRVLSERTANSGQEVPA